MYSFVFSRNNTIGGLCWAPNRIPDRKSSGAETTGPAASQSGILFVVCFICMIAMSINPMDLIVLKASSVVVLVY